MAFARVGLGADSGAPWTLQRLAGAARPAELLMLAESLENEAQVQAEPDGTADHRAATFAFLNGEKPVFGGR